jgi:hypothetical protein
MVESEDESIYFQYHEKDGTVGGNRTPNLRIWNPLLYQLSYDRTGVGGYHTQRKKELVRSGFEPP